MLCSTVDIPKHDVLKQCWIVDGAAVVANATSWIVFLWGCWAFI